MRSSRANLGSLTSLPLCEDKRDLAHQCRADAVFFPPRRDRPPEVFPEGPVFRPGQDESGVRAPAPEELHRLDEVAVMLGLPGKMGMSGAKVWDSFQAGDLAGIRNYCETDVLNTYLIYLRFEMIRGRLLAPQYEERCQQVRDYLEQSGKSHLEEFAAAWRAGNGG